MTSSRRGPVGLWRAYREAKYGGEEDYAQALVHTHAEGCTLMGRPGGRPSAAPKPSTVVQQGHAAVERGWACWC
eukprot:scaffold38_cov415-Prasinococcus_capsulatus_cf.AAC.10